MLSLSVLGNVRAASPTTTTTIRDRLTRLIGGSDDNNNISSNLNGDNNNNNNNDDDNNTNDDKPSEHSNCEKYCKESKSQHKSHKHHHRQRQQQQLEQQQQQEAKTSRGNPVHDAPKVTPAAQHQKNTKHQLLQQYYNCLQKQRQYQKEKRQRRRRDRSSEHGQGHSSASENDNSGGCSFLEARVGRPMKSPCDARTEAVTFLGLLKHEEERLVERSKELVRRDRSFIQEVFTCMVDEWTPLHACTLRGARKLVKVALKAGVNPDLEMGVPEGLPGRCAPLHLAAYRGDVSILQLLVQHGAHLDKPDDLNRTPLYYAVQRRNTLAARKLIKYGADCSGLTAEETDFFREDIAKRGHGPAVLCIPVPVRTGSQKHRHHHHHENHHFNSSSATTTSTTAQGGYHQHHRSSSSSGGGSSTKYKLDS